MNYCRNEALSLANLLQNKLEAQQSDNTHISIS